MRLQATEGTEHTKAVMCRSRRYKYVMRLYESDELWDGALEMAGQIASMNPGGVKLVLAHLDRIGDMTRDQALNWAKLSADWLDVKVGADELEGRILGK